LKVELGQRLRYWRRINAMYGDMAGTAQCDAVGQFRPQMRELSERLDVMSMQPV
jgi:hypothetical protein